MKMVHYVCMKLIHVLGVANTEQIQTILEYKNRHNVQVYVNEMKSNKWIYNQRIGNVHYWGLTNKGLEAIGKNKNSDIYVTTRELKERAILSTALEQLIKAKSLVYSKVNQSTAEITFQVGGKQWDVLLRTDGVVDMTEESLPTMLIVEDTTENAWALSQSLVAPTNVLLVSTNELISEHGIMGSIWGCNLVKDNYVSPLQLESCREKLDIPIGTKEWKDAVNEGSKERIFHS